MLDINKYLRTEGPSEIEITEMGEDVATATRLVALLREKLSEVNSVLDALSHAAVEVEFDVQVDRVNGPGAVISNILVLRAARQLFKDA
jgi:hypothetical protein